MIKKVENNVVSDPKGEETFFGGGGLQKRITKNKSKRARTERVIKKPINSILKEKVTIILSIIGLIKKT